MVYSLIPGRRILNSLVIERRENLPRSGRISRLNRCNTRRELKPFKTAQPTGGWREPLTPLIQAASSWAQTSHPFFIYWFPDWVKASMPGKQLTSDFNRFRNRREKGQIFDLIIREKASNRPGEMHTRSMESQEGLSENKGHKIVGKITKKKPT